MTFDEKTSLLEGLNVWQTKAYGNLPSITMSDGPHGIRKQNDIDDTIGAKGSVLATCFPTASLMACSFDKDLINKEAALIGKEARHFGVNIVLGPGINIKRTPLCGRNFEYYSEDPKLSGEFGAAFVRGLEDQGIGATPKHFFCNNQEKSRHTVNSVVAERALHEIYLAPFKRVIAENPAQIMASYNQINGYYASEHPMINHLIRNRWGYQGVIVSDWGAINDRPKSILASCDLEMPTSFGYHTDILLRTAQHDVDVKRQIERSAERIEQLVHKYKDIKPVEVDFEKHHEQARLMARESMVLLRNKDDILPLNAKENVAIISGFIDHIRYQGGGSSHMNPTQLPQIIDIVDNYSNNLKCAKGFRLDSKASDKKLMNEALELANQVKKVIYIVGVSEKFESEGFDRNDLDLPQNQIDLFHEIYKYNQNIIVVVLSGSVVNVSFAENARGMLAAYLGGQAASQAILDILYGRVNPSGRLAETWIDNDKDCNVVITNDNYSTYYDESIYVGYRYYETFKQPVRFPFGHGLSYTTFSYKDLSVVKENEQYKVSVTVRNTGQMLGKEVVQLYVKNNQSSVFKAIRELKGFKKIEVKPGEEKAVTFTLSRDDFAYYDWIQKRWNVEEGDYGIEIGKNVRNIIESVEIHVSGREIKHPLISYNQYYYNTTDFAKLYGAPLPPKNIKIKRPFTINNTLNDVSSTLIGRIVRRQIIKRSVEASTNDADPAMQEVVRRAMVETPMRMFGIFSNKEVTLHQVEGLVDIINLKFFKGFKKWRKK